MRWCIPNGEETLFGPERGCDQFEQRLLRFDGGGDTRMSDEEDELLYVLAGHGRLAIGDDTGMLEPGAAAYVARGTPWTISATGGLKLLSVKARDPLPGATHAFIGGSESDSGTATAGRSFRMLCCPTVGCNTATQFIGHIPPGRAPDHYHEYDEVIYVLEGEGLLEIGGEQAPIAAGTCIHLPRRLVHCLANLGETELRVLGVFRPAGSPAEAYYPDGTRAAVSGGKE